MKNENVSIEIDGAKLSALVESKKKSLRSIDKALGFGKDYLRGCIKRNRIDENRFIDVLAFLKTSRQKAQIETVFDLSEVPTWQLNEEIKRRYKNGR